MKGFWLTVQVILDVCQVFTMIGLMYLFAVRMQLSAGVQLPVVHELLQRVPGAAQAGDVISCALQLGRLDMVSMSLTILGAAIALFGFAGFWMIAREAVHAAKKETQAFLNSPSGKQCIDHYVRQYLREGIERYPSDANAERGRYTDISQDMWDNPGGGGA